MLAAFLACLAASPVATITIDATVKKPISPYIYGVNHPEWDGIGPGVALARQGGNRMTAYNWETNASNAGNDFHHQNDNYVGDSNEPGWTVRTFIEAAQKHGAAAIVTVPTAGFVSADKNGDGDVNKTPNYLDVRFHKSFARKPGGRLAFPPDTSDKAVYQDEFVSFVLKKVAAKTPVWFSLDNEPDLWQSTHARIRPRNAGYAGILANNAEFGTMIRSIAPKAMIFGPASYGWHGFRTFQDAPDRNGRDFLDFYLAGMKDAAKDGPRVLDSLDVHWYPEALGGGQRISTNDPNQPEATHEARIQAPRSLWDPTYVETSWITKDSIPGQAIRLIPRIQAQIANHYPGTKLSILEYNYGGSTHASGMLAQADALGIFGRYGLFAACNWGLTPRDNATLAGFRAFCNFDGRGSRFGTIGLAVGGEVPSETSVYASIDDKAPQRIVLVVLNKTNQPHNFRFAFKGFTPKTATAWTAQLKGGPQKSSIILYNGHAGLGANARSVTTIEFRG